RRLRRHADRPPAPREGLARPRLPHDADVLLEEPPPLRALDARHGELLGAIAEPGDQARAAPAREIEHGELLGQAHRVVQRHQHGGDADADVLRAPRDRGGEHERRREIAVVDAVVLGEHDEVEALPVGPGALLEARRVELGVGGGAEGRRAEIVAEADHGHGALVLALWCASQRSDGRTPWTWRHASRGWRIARRSSASSTATGAAST